MSSTAEAPLEVGQLRENPHNGYRCRVKRVVDETHADVDWLGWPHSSGVQDVRWTRLVSAVDRRTTKAALKDGSRSAR